MEKRKLKQLLKAYQEGTIKKNDLITLLDYIAIDKNETQVDQLLAELMEDMKEDPALPVASDRLYERIVTHPQFRSKPGNVVRLYYRLAAAVAVLLVLIGGVWWYTTQYRNHDENHYTARTVTTKPTDKLLLKTSKGQIIELDQLTPEGTGIPTIQFADQEGLVYSEDGNEAMQEEHTIITPKGRQYHIVLSDGTKVWLNSATTITFPAHFKGDLREVELDGEAYFEVKKAIDWPFTVQTYTQSIEVLGTHFNVNAYREDDVAYTTLLEGKVRLSSGKNKIILHPGQQAKSTTASSVPEVRNMEAKDAIAWKDDMFIFNNEEIQQAMRQISRWYDVEVVYRNGMEGKRIGGSVSRFENITELMGALQATGLLHYEMKGGTIIISE
ncbi:DUF4974 domain-containing protein [Sphingobacterium sp. SGG-5]|uniref:FecR family protein n=1 Tax=Sphingobacterium sp. SGG-5 TaxID=2710881 RepID=UPI0013EAA393|nr:FecR family protein [Sphingobacterium sp. SGG-5]NGM60822.1 DUF4974 domain-containing protein [Sphingobacterium sp. SGG-5]